MQKISQRVLMHECLESMQKVAATGATNSLLQQIVGNVQRSFRGKNGKNLSPSQALDEILQGVNSKPADSFINNTVRTLKKKLNAKEIEKMKNNASKNEDLLTETGKALLKGKDLGGATGAGAAIGAAAGALQDTDEESTNMLGVTQKRKGKFTDRLKNMATGAAIGAAGGAGLKAKNIAKRTLDENIKSKIKNVDITKGLSNDDVLQKAFSSLAAGDYNGEVMQHLDKAFNSYMKTLGKSDSKPLKDALEKAMLDKSQYSIEGLKPGNSGVLERLWDSMLGRKAKRNAVANDYNRALNILLQKDPEAVRQWQTYVSKYKSPREAFLDLHRGNRGKDVNKNPILDDVTLDGITKILNGLTDDTQSSAIAKAFQNRARPMSLPFMENPKYDPDWLHNIRNWMGISNPNYLDAQLRDFAGNSQNFNF